MRLAVDLGVAPRGAPYLFHFARIASFHFFTPSLFSLAFVQVFIPGDWPARGRVRRLFLAGFWSYSGGDEHAFGVG